VTVNIERRFWSKVNKNGPTQPHMDSPCWEWTGAHNYQGYGRFGVDGINNHAHRVSFMLRGAIPSGLCVLHRCDNPPCVRPDHLWLGTRADNIADMDAKGRRVFHSGPAHANFGKPVKTPAFGDKNGSRRHPERLPRGSSHWHARVSEADVMSIRACASAGEPLPELSVRFCVNYQTIWSIVRRRTWRHI
jgi:hypothetical protein